MKPVVTVLIAIIVPFLHACGLIYDYNECDDFVVPFFVDPDWQYSPEASPKIMTYEFFPFSGGVWRFDLPGKTGGEVDLPPGEYHFLSFNDENANILVRNPEDYATMECYCAPARLYDGLGDKSSLIGDNPETTAEGETVCRLPGMIWSDADDKVTVSNGEHKIVYPRRSVARYTYTVSDVTNLDGVRFMCASLGGVASGIRLSDRSRRYPLVTVPFKVTRVDETTLSDTFYTFGAPHSSDVSNILTLYFWLGDGRKINYRFDVTAQIHDAPDPFDVKIIVSGIDLPYSDSVTEGGFDVSIDGWETTVIDIFY